MGFLLPFVMLTPPAYPRLHSPVDGASMPIPSASITHRLATAYIFVLRQCPVADQYLPVIEKYKKQFEHQGIQFEIVFEDENLTRTKAIFHLKKYGCHAKVKLDPYHKFAHTWKATTSPEAFLVSKKGQLVYHGRIDDRYLTLGSPRPHATQHDLLDSIEQFIQGTTISEPYARPIGCILQL